MSQNETTSRSTGSESKLQVTGYDEKEKAFIVQSPMGNILKISDTYAEMSTIMEISPANPLFSVSRRHRCTSP
jgi:hypothetical protein